MIALQPTAGAGTVSSLAGGGADATTAAPEASSDADRGWRMVRAGADGRWRDWRYRVRVVDVDPKPLRKLEGHAKIDREVATLYAELQAKGALVAPLGGTPAC